MDSVFVHLQYYSIISIRITVTSTPRPFLPRNIVSHQTDHSSPPTLLPHSILLRPLPRLLIKSLPILLKLLRGTLLHRIIRNRLHHQLLRSRQHAHDLARWLPGVGFEDADAHAAVLVEGYVGVPDAGLEGELGGLEGVFVGEGEEKVEFAALETRQKGGLAACAELMVGLKWSAWDFGFVERERKRETYSVRRALGTVHDDVPGVDVGFVCEADFDTCWWVLGHFSALLLTVSTIPFLAFYPPLEKIRGRKVESSPLRFFSPSSCWRCCLWFVEAGGGVAVC